MSHQMQLLKLEKALTKINFHKQGTSRRETRNADKRIIISKRQTDYTACK